MNEDQAQERAKTCRALLHTYARSTCLRAYAPVAWAGRRSDRGACGSAPRPGGRVEIKHIQASPDATSGGRQEVRLHPGNEAAIVCTPLISCRIEPQREDAPGWFRVRARFDGSTHRSTNE